MARSFWAFAIALNLIATASAQQTKPTLVAGRNAAPAHSHAAHDHGTVGPNKGNVLEIGRGEYHAELVVDEETKQVTIYLLDSKLKSYVAIDSPFVTVNFKIGNKPAQVKLLPVPLDADAKGASSRFSLINAELFEALHDAKSDAKLSLRIDKKNYVTKLSHTHEHVHTVQSPIQSAPKKR